MITAIDLTSVSDNLSGLERMAVCLSYEMVRLRPDITFVIVIKNSLPEPLKRFRKFDNVKFARVKGGKLAVNQIKLPFAMAGIKADAYIFPAFPVPLLFGKKKGRRIYGTVADTAVFDVPDTMKLRSRLLFGAGLKHTAKVCDSVITISEFSKSRIKKNLPYVKDITLAYCAVDEINTASSRQDVRKKYGLPEKYLLALSTVEPRKNAAFLSRGYEAYRKAGGELPLVFAGRNGWLTDTEKLDNLIFTGFIDDEDLTSVYAGAEAFLDASVYEGFGMPPLEALKCGVKKLFVSDIPAHREVLLDAAEYFDKDDENAFALGLIRYLDEPVTDKRLDAIERRLKAFSWKESAERILNAVTV